MKNMLTIGQLAKRTQVTTVTIRYYERQGLIAQSKRSHSGYRLYPENIISQFHFIQNGKAVGFTLNEIKALLLLQQQENATSQSVRSRALLKLKEIETKIETLRTMEKALSTWTNACDGKVPVEQCPILENLYQQKT